MEGKNDLNNVSAAKLTASIFGILSGLGGLTHGVGETLQGNVSPDGTIINSWTQGPIAAYMDGDPGMTIVPNLLITGILTIIVSLTLIVWSVAFVHRKNGGMIQICLSTAMLLVGGGFGPPTIGVLAGVAGLGINSRHIWWRTHLSVNIRSTLARLFPWVFGVCVINGVFLVIGSLILVYLFAFNNPDLFVNSFFFAVSSLLLSIITGIAYDIQNSALDVAV